MLVIRVNFSTYTLHVHMCFLGHTQSGYLGDFQKKIRAKLASSILYSPTKMTLRILTDFLYHKREIASFLRQFSLYY